MRVVDVDIDIRRYESLLNYARSKVDGVSMLALDMLVRLGDVKGYNYSTNIARVPMRIEETNIEVNSNPMSDNYASKMSHDVHD